MLGDWRKHVKRSVGCAYSHTQKECAIAILPSIASQITSIKTLILGGTGLLIVVSVILDTAKQFESKLIERSYEVFARR